MTAPAAELAGAAEEMIHAVLRDEPHNSHMQLDLALRQWPGEVIGQLKTFLVN